MIMRKVMGLVKALTYDVLHNTLICSSFWKKAVRQVSISISITIMVKIY